MTATKYEFDAVRWCDSMKKAHFARKDFTTAENFKQTRMRIEELEACVAELKNMFDDAMQTSHLLEGGISALCAENDTLRNEARVYREQCDMANEWRDKIEGELTALKGAARPVGLCENSLRVIRARAISRTNGSTRLTHWPRWSGRGEMSVNRFDDLCDKLDSAVFNGDWLFDAENRSIFEEYLRRWDIELKSHESASENNSDYAALLARHNALREAVCSAHEKLQMILKELPRTIGDVNMPLIMKDLAEVDRLLE